MSAFTVTEPHPTVVAGSFTRAGRGGAGNYFRAPATTPSSGIPTVAKPLPPSSERWFSGRGGAGNARAASDRDVVSFDEQYKLQSHIEERSTGNIGHLGRGGAGNVFGASSSSQRKPSDASSCRSNSSSGSVKSGFLKRLSSISSKGPHP